MMNTSPPGRIARLVLHRKSAAGSHDPSGAGGSQRPSGPPTVSRRSVRRTRLALIGLALAAVLCAAAVPIVSAGASSPRASASDWFPSQDGLGVQSGKVKHVWLIILENKSYDATFTGLNNNTYLWQTLPAQGVLLKNYYGTGHFSLDNYVSLVSGQATQPDTQADCPYYDKFSGAIDTSGSLLTNPNYGQVASAQGPNAAAGQTAASTRRACRRCSTSSTLPTSAGRATRRTSATRMRAAPAHDRGHASTAALPTAHPVRPAAPRSPTRAAPTRPTSTCPSISPSPGSSRSCQAGDCNSAAHRQPVRFEQRPLPRPAERVHDSRLQLDLAEQLQRRPRRRLSRQQPLRRLLRPEHAR